MNRTSVLKDEGQEQVCGGSVKPCKIIGSPTGFHNLNPVYQVDKAKHGDQSLRAVEGGT